MAIWMEGSKNDAPMQENSIRILWTFFRRDWNILKRTTDSDSLISIPRTNFRLTYWKMTKTRSKPKFQSQSNLDNFNLLPIFSFLNILHWISFQGQKIEVKESKYAIHLKIFRSVPKESKKFEIRFWGSRSLNFWTRIKNWIHHPQK